MTVPNRSTALLTALALAVLSAALARFAFGTPELTQHQMVVPSEVQLLQNRVAELEKKVAALQQQYASHTHNYNPPRCNAFLNLATFRNVLNNPASEPGMGICLVQPGGGMAATGTPNH